MSDGSANHPSSDEVIHSNPVSAGTNAAARDQPTAALPSGAQNQGQDQTQAQEQGQAQPQQPEEQDPAHKKRDDFLHDLLRELDMLVYVELAAIYYLDTSNLLLTLRVLLHLTHLTIPSLTFPSLHPHALLPNHPKPPIRAPNTPLLLLASLFCLLVHLFTAPPSASELSRFHLHGSLLVDFVGQFAQEGWWTRLRLCVMDLVVVGVQGVCCAVAGERVRSNGSGAGASNSTINPAAGGGGDAGQSITAAASAAFTAFSTRRVRMFTGGGAVGVGAGVGRGVPVAVFTGVGAEVEMDELSTSGRRVGSAAGLGSGAEAGGDGASAQEASSGILRRENDTADAEAEAEDEGLNEDMNTPHEHEPNESEPLLDDTDTIPLHTIPPHTVPPHAAASSPPPPPSQPHQASQARQETTDPVHRLEQLDAGQFILAELHLVDMVRNHFWEARNRRLGRGSGMV